MKYTIYTSPEMIEAIDEATKKHIEGIKKKRKSVIVKDTTTTETNKKLNTT